MVKLKIYIFIIIHSLLGVDDEINLFTFFSTLNDFFKWFKNFAV